MKELSNARKLMLALTLVAYLVMFGLVMISGMKVDFSSEAASRLLIAAFMIVCGALATWRKMEALRAAIETICCGLLLVVPIVLSTYLAIRTNFPLADGRLVAMDRTLGVDWATLIHWIDARPNLAAAFTQAYQTFAYQLLLIPIILVCTGRIARSYQMVSGYGLICFISSAISVFYPAEGTYVTYGIEPGSLENINSFYAFAFLEQFHAVRSDPGFVFRIEESFGILTFPSVHTAVAVLCAWAAWDLRLLRYPLLALNVLMALSTIPEGSHYVVDVIAGIGVAGFSIAVICAVTRSESLIPARLQIREVRQTI